MKTSAPQPHALYLVAILNACKRPANALRSRSRPATAAGARPRPNVQSAAKIAVAVGGR